MSARIQALDEAVVHKIAAGEIIVSPVNALKELIENSLDAGASNIEVVVKEGGHKLLQITDDGKGINTDDLPLLCQRFTTSKLQKFEDLETVQTLGFRGEALASISHISHLTVKTKTQDSKAATVAQFESGNLISKKLSAGVTGTQITVEDLFYNTPLRRKALKSNSDSSEYQKIVDVLTKYAIMYEGTFSCKRFQDTQPVVINAASQKEKLRKVYGTQAYQNLIELKIGEKSEFGVQKIEGWVTGLNYTAKRSSPFIFFINKRLVSCEPLSRAIRKVYQDHLPKQSSYPVVFLSLDLDTHNVDVNVHPTKREVHFLYDTEIIEIITSEIVQLITKTSDSRDFSVQSYIASTSFDSSDGPVSRASLSVNKEKNDSFVSGTTSFSKPRYEYNLVRTDPQQQKLTSFIEPSRTDPSQVSPQKAHARQSQTSNADCDTSSEPELPFDSLTKDVRPFNLISINEILADINRNANSRLLNLLSHHTFVGIVDFTRGLAAIQNDVRLYLVSYMDMCSELFYQLALTNLGNFGTIHLGDGILISELLEKSEAEVATHTCFEFQEMLEDHFNIKLDQRGDGWYLCQMPLLLRKYVFPVSRLKQFVNDLVFEICWKDEKTAIQNLAAILGKLHVPTPETKPEDIEKLFNAAKTELVPSQRLVPGVIEIANLPGLYRVFERC